MVWTSPRTWVAGEKPTAATLNLHIRDQFKAIGDAWTSYGSGASWTGSGSNPAIGNGTWAGAYIQFGKLIIFRATVTAGSTTTYGSGGYAFDLPVTAAGAGRVSIAGLFRDTSASADYPILGILTSGATTAVLRTWPTTAGNPLAAMSPAVPVTMANGDSITLSGVYESA